MPDPANAIKSDESSAASTEPLADDNKPNGKAYSDDALRGALAEWDEHKKPPETEGRNEQEIAEINERIETLESENSGLTERAENAEGALEFVDESLTKIDEHDASQLADRFTKKTGLSHKAALEMIRTRVFTDSDFRDLADARHDRPDEYESAIERFEDELAEQFPPPMNYRGIAQAVRIGRAEHTWGGTSAEDKNYGDLSTMNNDQFETAKREIFEDMRSGKLRPEGKSSGGFIGTAPR